MTTLATDEQLQAIGATARPYALAILWWADRHMDGAEEIERAHQRRIVGLKIDGVIPVLLPVGSETIAGVAILDRTAEEAEAILGEDPCVKAGMMRLEVQTCHGFPGDALPG